MSVKSISVLTIAKVDLALEVFQVMGGCIFVSVAQSIFGNIMIRSLMRNAPTVNPIEIVRVGATGLKASLSPKLYAVAIKAYIDALQAVFGLALGLAALGTVLALLVPHHRLQPGMPSIA